MNNTIEEWKSIIHYEAPCQGEKMQQIQKRKECQTMNKNVLMAPFCILMIALLIGCGNPIKEDMINYSKKLDAIDKSFELMRSKVDKIGDDKDDYLKVIRGDIIPFFNDAKEKIENIDIKTKEVLEINNIFIIALELYAKSFDQISDAIEYMDEDRIKESEQTMAEAENKIDEGNAKWEKLTKKYNVKNIITKLMNNTIKPRLN
jgi:predicted phage tail protein